MLLCWILYRLQSYDTSLFFSPALLSGVWQLQVPQVHPFVVYWRLSGQNVTSTPWAGHRAIRRCKERAELGVATHNMLLNRGLYHNYTTAAVESARMTRVRNGEAEPERGNDLVQ